ncbi:LuxR family quorum-sensing transcriptional regulator LasR [Pseudoduganella flava]|uniref:LuxR family quorum-sensing transcriptional regulator LasR n=1 Tax=Pseudoduganella flava TaxID=871742 RepID=A0A562PNZ8_9BURK|nr:autoinducer binding domain-containing protein [Pseudoduganella flava]QGZ40723.1 LuxR family transcriptional regulator [Pseudoduganella flava]TWI45796.1 LuxR family quorum-sensing transcriptional regulator LasR [Pseudoduganella flava]
MDNMDGIDASVPDPLSPFGALMSAASDGEAMTQLQAAVRSLGFEQMIFAVMPRPNVNPADVYLRSNYPQAWRSYYDEHRLRETDPTVEYCFKASAPFIWMPQSFKTDAQHALYEEAATFGLRVGVTLPIRGPGGEVGMLTCVRDQQPGAAFLKDLNHHLPGLTLLRDVAFDAMKPYVRPAEPPEEAPVLTARELDVLQWMAAGKTAWEIGRILSISEAGVNFHIGNLRTKFAVGKRNDVVLKAIRLGLISLPG